MNVHITHISSETFLDIEQEGKKTRIAVKRIAAVVGMKQPDEGKCMHVIIRTDDGKEYDYRSNTENLAHILDLA